MINSLKVIQKNKIHVIKLLQSIFSMNAKKIPLNRLKIMILNIISL